MILLVVAAWLAISLGFNYPALFADAYECECDYREDMAHSLFFALVPIVGTVVAIFGTGFCQHGFKWK